MVRYVRGSVAGGRDSVIALRPSEAMVIVSRKVEAGYKKGEGKLDVERGIGYGLPRGCQTRDAAETPQPQSSSSFFYRHTESLSLTNGLTLPHVVK